MRDESTRAGLAWVVFCSRKYHGKALFLKFQKSEAAREQKSSLSVRFRRAFGLFPSLFPRRRLPHRTCSFSHSRIIRLLIHSFFLQVK